MKLYTYKVIYVLKNSLKKKKLKKSRYFKTIHVKSLQIRYSLRFIKMKYTSSAYE